MILQDELFRARNKTQIQHIMSYIGSDTKRFAELMALFFGKNYRITQQAAWLLSHCANAHPSLLEPYLPELITNLENTKLAAVKRNIVRVLQLINIPEALQGRLADCCFNFLATNEPVAMKAYSLTVLANLAKQEPDLKNELRLLIEDQLPHASAAFVARAKKLLPNLANTPRYV